MMFKPLIFKGYYALFELFRNVVIVREMPLPVGGYCSAKQLTLIIVDNIRRRRVKKLFRQTKPKY
jgi:hypothetical protein